MGYEVYGLIAALSFGLNAVLVKKALKHTTPATATVSVAAVQTLILSTLLVFDRPAFNLEAVMYFIAAGFFAAIIGRTFNYMSIEKLGVPVSTSLVGTNPLWAMILGVVFLGEAVTLSTISGSILVVAGVALISGGGKSSNLNIRDMLIPLVSAFFYAASSAVRKVGLNILPESVLGAVVGAMTGLIAYPILMRLMGRANEFKFTREAVPFLISGGITTSVAWISMFMATQQGPVGVVSAIIGANPLFGLILSVILLKDSEKITPQMIIGCVTIVAAVLIITLF
ncbi:DMT family transporter [Candidatus Bathyarchaeota archaeon]|jgi:drug/metabolite transporter (DMT)-like permease|nr:DMT family transporter [Candidatus Bathyarchaeota archaeon]MBT4319648.1 DMT family transporter [Candidatus Bathyarchaeota archaeon]MBT4424669.1 DMT family transporter [Candidatus Bathyarchaeota archaeon]MBT5642621.1 DMT family transporter [Candidatus Bathyarchaeota archaeon]MBT6604601.1 DMT family transporter [Candidatus Bathyarchaeota archaeon]